MASGAVAEFLRAAKNQNLMMHSEHRVNLEVTLLTKYSRWQ
jgi:hypothetical protein